MVLAFLYSFLFQTILQNGLKNDTQFQNNTYHFINGGYKPLIDSRIKQIENVACENETYYVHYLVVNETTDMYGHTYADTIFNIVTIGSPKCNILLILAVNGRQVSVINSKIDTQKVIDSVLSNLQSSNNYKYAIYQGVSEIWNQVGPFENKDVADNTFFIHLAIWSFLSVTFLMLG